MSLCFTTALSLVPRTLHPPLRCPTQTQFLPPPLRLRATRPIPFPISPKMSTAPPDRKSPKELAKLYGGSYLFTSILISLVNYALFYGLISVGVDVRAVVTAFGNLLASTPIGYPHALDSLSDTASAAGLAYILHKVVSPVRFPITVAATPIVAGWFTKKKADGKQS